MKLRLHIWKQADSHSAGRFETFDCSDVSPDMSFLELLDELNEELIAGGRDPVAFDHDCREGICGACGLMINGVPHGPLQATTTCQLYLREFSDGDEITVEPWRAGAFSVIRDLVVDRGALDRILQAGGYISVRTGSAPDGNTLPVPKEDSERAFAAATCIGCGACVAACPNAAAMLFTGAKISHLALLPQGRPEAAKRAIEMLRTMDELGFGNCTNERECEAECPKEISIVNIARMNREFLKASFISENDAL